MTAHIEWFGRVLTTAIQLYFRQECEYASIEAVAPPADGWLEEVTGERGIPFAERVVVLLALMPHISPQTLDILFVQNKNFDRPYTEFGGWKGLSHGGFLPTGETASFLLAGENPEKRKAVVRLFGKEHWFHTRNILQLEGAAEGEPFLSGQLRATGSTNRTTAPAFPPAASSPHSTGRSCCWIATRWRRSKRSTPGWPTGTPFWRSGG